MTPLLVFVGSLLSELDFDVNLMAPPATICRKPTCPATSSSDGATARVCAWSEACQQLALVRQ